MLATLHVRQYGTLWVRCGTGRVPLWHYLVPCGWQVQKQRGTRCATLSDQIRLGSYLLIKCMSRTAQDVADLVPHQLFDPRAGPSAELIHVVVEMKQRNPNWGCPRIAQQIALAFNLQIDKDVVRRILAQHYLPG